MHMRYKQYTNTHQWSKLPNRRYVVWLDYWLGLQRAPKALGNERYLHAGGRLQRIVHKPVCQRLPWASILCHLHKLSWQLFSQTYLLQRQHLTVFWTQLLRHWKNNHIQTSHLHLMKTLQEIRNNTSWKHSRLSAIQHMNQFRAAGENGCLPYFYTTKVVLILTVTQRMFSDIFRRKVNCAQNCLLTLQLLPDLGGRELQPRLQNKLQHHCHAQPVLSYHLSKKTRSYYSIIWTTTKTSPSLLHEKKHHAKIYKPVTTQGKSINYYSTTIKTKEKNNQGSSPV